MRSLALDHDLEVVPVINKIDLINADPDRAAKEIEDIICIPQRTPPRISAKTGLNIVDVMEAIVARIPAPKGDSEGKLKALIFDSVYDSYRGVIVYVRVFDGKVKAGDIIRMMATGAEMEVVEVGALRPFGFEPSAELSAGDVGYITASIKNVKDAEVGDTVTLALDPTEKGAARLQKGTAHGFQRYLSRRRLKIRRLARRARKTQTQ